MSPESADCGDHGVSLKDGLGVKLLFHLAHKAEHLQLGKKALARARPLLHVVARVANGALVYFFSLDWVERHRPSYQLAMALGGECELANAVEKHY